MCQFYISTPWRIYDPFPAFSCRCRNSILIQMYKISHLEVLGDINRTRSERFLLVPRTVLISPVPLISGDLLARIWRFWRVRTPVIVRNPPGLSHGVRTTHYIPVSVLEIVTTVTVPDSTQTLCSLVVGTVYLGGLSV